MSKEAMIDLMTRLSHDRKESQEFRDDPDRIMADLDLTEAEREMLKRGRREEIREYLGGGPTDLFNIGILDAPFNYPFPED